MTDQISAPLRFTHQSLVLQFDRLATTRRYFDCENKEDEMGCESEVVFECKMGPTDKEAQSDRLPQLYICDGFVYLFLCSLKKIFLYLKTILMEPNKEKWIWFL